MESERKISVESALKQFDEFCEYYDIDFEEEVSVEEDSSDEDKAIARAMKNFKKKIVKGLEQGRLEFSFENGLEIQQNFRDGKNEIKTITYREIDGKAKTAMSSKKENDSMGKCYALLGSLCGLGETAIKNLKGKDLSLAESLGGILLLV